MSRHNKTLASHLQAVQCKEAKGSRMQAHYLSPETQNEFIEECGKSVLRTVVDEVKKALYYSIITDGTPDVSHTEQITFVLRFVKRNENNSWEVFERFLKVEAMEKKKGLDIANLICDVLKEHEIDLKNCQGQGEAKVMTTVQTWQEYIRVRKLEFLQKIPKQHSFHVLGTTQILQASMPLSRQLWSWLFSETFSCYTIFSAEVQLVGRYCKKLPKCHFIHCQKQDGAPV